MGDRDIFNVQPGQLGFDGLSFVSLALIPGLRDAISVINSLQSQMQASSKLASDNGFLLSMQAAMASVQMLTQSISQIILIWGEIAKSIVSNMR